MIGGKLQIVQVFHLQAQAIVRVHTQHRERQETKLRLGEALKKYQRPVLMLLEQQKALLFLETRHARREIENGLILIFDPSKKFGVQLRHFYLKAKVLAVLLPKYSAQDVFFWGSGKIPRW